MTGKIYVTTPSGATMSDLKCEWDLKRPVVVDRLDCRELGLTVDRRVPIQQYSIVKVKDNGMVKFRGYCESNSIDSSSPGKTKWEVKGMENLLNKRFANRYFYKADTSAISEILADTLTHEAVPGLLGMANSAVPPGLEWAKTTPTSYLATLPGHGTDSYFADRDLYILSKRGLSKLGEYDEAALPHQSDGYYRDADDLQVVFTDVGYGWNLHGGLFVENAFDTTVRLGEVPDLSHTLAGDLETDQDEIGDLIADIVNVAGYTLRIRDDDDYTYLDLMEDDGRGSAGGLYTIREGERGFISISKSTTSGPKIHAAIGIGFGEQRYSVDNTSWTGIRIHELVEVEEGFIGEGQRFQNKVDDFFAGRQDDTQYDIEIAKSYMAYPGDYFMFYPKNSARTLLRSFEIAEDSKGKTTLSLGGKNINYVDVEDARTSFPRGFSDKYLRVLQPPITESGTIYVSDIIHVDSPTGLTFAVPFGVTDSKLNPKIILSVSVTCNDNVIAWATGTAYVAANNVYHTSTSGETTLYKCISNHTAAAASEPGVGASWETYWTATAETLQLDLGRCSLEVKHATTTVIDGNVLSFGANSTEGNNSFDIDVTSYVTELEDSVFKIWVHMDGNYTQAHTSITDHPRISISGTMNFYKRSSI